MKSLANCCIKKPLNVLIIGKSIQKHFITFTHSLCVFLLKQSPTLVIYVDSRLSNNALLANNKNILFWTPQFCLNNHEIVDMIITIGGDGTVLYASWLFQNSKVPPVIPFHLGSLGFLSDFDLSAIKNMFINIFSGKPTCVSAHNRTRLNATVYKCSDSADSSKISRRKDSISRSNAWFPDVDICAESATETPLTKDVDENSRCVRALIDDTELKSLNLNRSLKNYSSRSSLRLRSLHFIPSESFHVLNEVVLDRGPSAYMSQLELFVDGNHLTTVQADGLVLSTPTGSTAYSMSAGGSLVHPDVPTILVSPICPHSLSFRPMLLPDSAEIKIQVPMDSRHTVWVSFDGKHRIELANGDYVLITRSRYPMITLSSKGLGNGWFQSLSRCLHWNERTRQKGIDCTEEEFNVDKLSMELLQSSSEFAEI